MPAIRNCQEALAQEDARTALDYDVRMGMIQAIFRLAAKMKQWGSV
jgi:hypothetical protein